MKHGFIKVASISCPIKVADCKYNTDNIISYMNDAINSGAKLVVFPELCITGCTCADLFRQRELMEQVYKAIKKIKSATTDTKALIAVGSPIIHANKLYSCTVFFHNGRILAVVPKANLSWVQRRVFYSSPKFNTHINILGDCVPFGNKTLLSCSTLPEFTVAAEVGEDLLSLIPPSVHSAAAGATVIVNSAGFCELSDSPEKLDATVKAHSERLCCAYMLANAGEGESTTDYVYSGSRLICEGGNILAHGDTFTSGITISEIDTQLLTSEKCHKFNNDQYECIFDDVVQFDTDMTETILTRRYTQNPFIPDSGQNQRFEHILQIQANALKKRVQHTNCHKLVIGISGGLDSCLALLVSVRTMQLLNRPLTDILAVTMPCFGTTTRTKSNADKLCELLGVEYECIDIAKSVKQHFDDIGHDMDNYNVVFENAQARERTQILMDLANKHNGMVIGTGDLSELVLGWATYSGDHMSMYGVNAGIPKTIVRCLVHLEAERYADESIKSVLFDILDTPVSPELLPASDDRIGQKTEELVGPYELHDFFLYYALRYGFSPDKIFRICCYSLGNMYSDEIIKKWLKNFYSRFFNQQFKRSCLPDGPKVGSVGVSPRGDLVMPSDASCAAWANMFE